VKLKRNRVLDGCYRHENLIR